MALDMSKSVPLVQKDLTLITLKLLVAKFPVNLSDFGVSQDIQIGTEKGISDQKIYFTKRF